MHESACALCAPPACLVQSADLEAERLFDYGVLAPPVRPSPLSLTTCQDTRLAGAGWCTAAPWLIHGFG